MMYNFLIKKLKSLTQHVALGYTKKQKVFSDSPAILLSNTFKKF